jgi:hypothetical protein
MNIRCRHASLHAMAWMMANACKADATYLLANMLCVHTTQIAYLSLKTKSVALRLGLVAVEMGVMR